MGEKTTTGLDCEQQLLQYLLMNHYMLALVFFRLQLKCVHGQGCLLRIQIQRVLKQNSAKEPRNRLPNAPLCISS